MRPDDFHLEALFERYEHAPGMLVLGASDASSLTLAELFALVGETLAFESVKLAYSDVKGELRLRDTIARSYDGARLTADRVLVTLGRLMHRHVCVPSRSFVS